MADQDSPRSIQLTDPRALRAYAHPTRLALVGLLRRSGPMTATQAADAIGESVASCSFHLRQLAKYGLVEKAGGGRGREKPWQATAMFTSWEAHTADPAAAAATEALELAVAERYFEIMARWIQTRAEEPAQWQEAARFGDTMLHLTVAELHELGEKFQELMQPYLERIDDSTKRPAHSRPITVLQLAIPLDTNRDNPQG
ncbi:helix-turn-helix domain-containing protein [Nocardia sp. NBC_01499]|uniref:winged helix-turn-helix domain-containing protein n=1 Tax=Nocardia sp. NBC_01499 TaxID=2903597 RepID=UPI00387061DD